MKTIFTTQLLAISPDKKISVDVCDNIDFNRTVDVFTTFSSFYGDNRFEDRINTILNNMKIDIAELFKTSLSDSDAVDDVCVSKKINHKNSKINYVGRIIVKYIENYNGEKVLDEKTFLNSIHKYFEILDMAILSGEKIETIAIPLITTHISGISNDLLLIPFIRECIYFFKKNRKIKEIIIIEENETKAQEFVEKLNDSYLLHYYKNPIMPYKRPSIYISYDNNDIDMLHHLSKKLIGNKFSVKHTTYDSSEKKDDFSLYKCMDSICFIVILSENSIISHRVLNELDLAIETHRNPISLVVLKVDSVKIIPSFNYYLKYCRIIDIQDVSEVEWSNELITILDYNDKLSRPIKLEEKIDLIGNYPLLYSKTKSQNKEVSLCLGDLLWERQKEDANQETSSNIDTCPCCGTFVEEKSIYCKNCGAKLQIEKNNKTLKLTEVQFSAVIPDRYQIEKYLTVDIFMYEEIYKKIVDEKVTNSSQNVKVVSSGIQEVNYNTRVRIELNSPDIKFSEEETQKWVGKYSVFTFCINIPKDIEKKEILFIASIYFNDIIATKLKFIVKKDEKDNQTPNIERKDIMSAFISYASQDRTTVTKIIQGMKSARPDLDIFFDVESLRSGENWEERIKKEIEKRDTLYLCWSKYAKESRYVTMEWKYALDKKGIESIEPIPLVSPSECIPPEELKCKHFNDKILYFR